MSESNGHPNGDAKPSIDFTEMEYGHGQKDLAMVKRLAARSKRWRIPEAMKDETLSQINIVYKNAHLIGDTEKELKMRLTAAQVMSVFEGQNQKDEHADRELEANAAPKIHEHRHFVVKPPRVLGGGE